MKFETNHWCDNCGGLLFKSGKDFLGSIQIKCNDKKCKTINVKCGTPESVEVQVGLAYCGQRERIRQEFRNRK